MNIAMFLVYISFVGHFKSNPAADSIMYLNRYYPGIEKRIAWRKDNEWMERTVFDAGGLWFGFCDLDRRFLLRKHEERKRKEKKCRR